MAVLLSPSNNTGWGLKKTMYGGAQVRSDEHPVLVRQHFRAPWRALKRARLAKSREFIEDDDSDIMVPPVQRRRRNRLIVRPSVAFISRVLRNLRSRRRARRNRRPQ
ncbi:pVII [Bovine adenovirus 10]|uniref:PVII n=1 Tax=Bovine adenovirus C serotype 10 TaxID=39788 RepID=A0A9X9KQ89_ADEBA|nr:pVII [Bovine adenovirus 10]